MIRRYLADGGRPPEDAVLILAPASGDLENAAPLIDRLLKGAWRLSVVIVTDTGSPAVAARFPEAVIRTPRLPFRRLAFAVLAALRVRSVLLLAPEQAGRLTAALAQGAERRGVPVFRESLSDSDDLTSEASVADLSQAVAAAVGAERRPAFGIDRLAALFSGPAARRLLFPWLTRLESIEKLSRTLGRPASILCLGNGPSGRRPELAALDQDALFRVNHDWRADGMLEQPDMVFAGVKRSLRKLGPRLIGVATARKAEALIACRGFEPWHGPATYAVVDEIAGPVIPPVDGPLRPTTGAYMLATAVALRPKRLMVAGMDMFSHAQGAYAGGGADTNAYTPSHSFDTDAAFIGNCLKHYEGTLISFSPAFTVIAREAAKTAAFRLEDRGEP